MKSQHAWKIDFMHQREIHPHFTLATGMERAFFLSAAGSKHMCWLGYVARHLAMPAASKPPLLKIPYRKYHWTKWRKANFYHWKTYLIENTYWTYHKLQTYHPPKNDWYILTPRLGNMTISNSSRILPSPQNNH